MEFVLPLLDDDTTKNICRAFSAKDKYPKILLPEWSSRVPDYLDGDVYVAVKKALFRLINLDDPVRSLDIIKINPKGEDTFLPSFIFVGRNLELIAMAVRGFMDAIRSVYPKVVLSAPYLNQRIKNYASDIFESKTEDKPFVLLIDTCAPQSYLKKCIEYIHAPNFLRALVITPELDEKVMTCAGYPLNETLGIDFETVEKIACAYIESMEGDFISSTRNLFFKVVRDKRSKELFEPFKTSIYSPEPLERFVSAQRFLQVLFNTRTTKVNQIVSHLVDENLGVIYFSLAPLVSINGPTTNFHVMKELRLLVALRRKIVTGNLGSLIRVMGKPHHFMVSGSHLIETLYNVRNDLEKVKTHVKKSRGEEKPVEAVFPAPFLYPSEFALAKELETKIPVWVYATPEEIEAVRARSEAARVLQWNKYVIPVPEIPERNGSSHKKFKIKTVKELGIF